MDELQASDRALVQIRSSELMTLRSATTGREYVLRVALPLRAGDASCPVVYLHADFDGAFFALTTSLVRMLWLEAWLPPVWVVSVSPEMSAAERTLLRGFDVPRQLDGARDLLRGFLQDVLPAFEQRHPVDTSRRVLLGHSWGGLLVMQAIAEGQNEFHGYVASSPALWRLGDQLPALEARMAARTPPPAGKLFLSLGELEQPARVHGERVHERGALFQNVDRLRWLSQAIERRAYPELMMQTRVYAGETHMSVLPLAIMHGIGFLLGRSQEQAASHWAAIPEDMLRLLESARVPEL
jgi:predicted alpha/beta superfamily hydrolase